MWAQLLEDGNKTQQILELNRNRLADSYNIAVSWLDTQSPKIKYLEGG